MNELPVSTLRGAYDAGYEAGKAGTQPWLAYETWSSEFLDSPPGEAAGRAFADGHRHGAREISVAQDLASAIAHGVAPMLASASAARVIEIDVTATYEPWVGVLLRTASGAGYTATSDDYDLGHPHGEGETPEAAAAALCEAYEERADLAATSDDEPATRFVVRKLTVLK